MRGQVGGCGLPAPLAPALAVLTARQPGHARELIEDGAAVPGYDGVLYCVSTDGTEVYETTAGACACPASREPVGAPAPSGRPFIV